MNQDLVLVLYTAFAGVLLWFGVVRPLGVRSRQYGMLAPPESRDARIAKLECDTRMCEHAVGDEHPAKIWTRDGRAFWRLSDGRMWEEGTPCPFR
jgi:hypothetical protein